MYLEENNRKQGLTIEKLESFVKADKVDIDWCKTNRHAFTLQERTDESMRMYTGVRFETILEILKRQDEKIYELDLKVNEITNALKSLTVSIFKTL